MTSDSDQEQLLRKVLEQVVQNNRQTRAGTPMAELKAALDAAVSSLPPLEFEAFNQAIGDSAAMDRFVQKAPEIIGWDADHIVEWIEALSKKL